MALLSFALRPPSVGAQPAALHSLLELIAAATRAESVALWVPPHENHDELRCVARAGAARAARPRRGPACVPSAAGARGRRRRCPSLRASDSRCSPADDAADGDDADVQVVAAHATRDEAAPTHDPNHALCCVAVRRGGRTRLGTAEAQILLLGAGACAAAVRRFSSLPTAGGLAGAAPKLMLRSAIAATAKDVMKSRYQQQVQLSRARRCRRRRSARRPSRSSSTRRPRSSTPPLRLTSWASGSRRRCASTRAPSA